MGIIDSLLGRKTAENSYELPVRCGNCGRTSTVRIHKGQSLDKYNKRAGCRVKGRWERN